MTNNGKLLLRVEDLRTYFFLDEGIVRAVDGTSFDISIGETIGIVGESGCGKSVTARAILRIVPHPGRIVSGKINYYRHYQKPNIANSNECITLTDLHPEGREIRAIRGNEIAMIFQEPMTSFSPVHTIGQQIIEAITTHKDIKGSEARETALDTLQLVGMPKPNQTIDSFPHQLSGGMRQRAMIAMALSCRPNLLIADEPTTALDVTTQAQILDLLRKLQSELGMAIIFITHDLGVIAEMTRRVLVMYMGCVVESADIDDLFYNPSHPYTQALLRSIPHFGAKSDQRLAVIPGSVPDPYNIPGGCPFHPRCSEQIPGLCDIELPESVFIAKTHTVSCHLRKPEAKSV